MKIIEQSWSWVEKPVDVLKKIEIAARNCWKSEDKIKPGSDEKIVRMLLKKGHLSPIEFGNATIRIITNRGVLQEFARHRLISLAVESTRYVKYDGNMEFIRPVWWDRWTPMERIRWQQTLESCEEGYQRLIELGSRPEQAREVLPNGLKTEIVVTANLREFLWIFNLRCSPQAHPQIRALMKDVLAGFHAEIPVVFDDLAGKYLQKDLPEKTKRYFENLEEE